MPSWTRCITRCSLKTYFPKLIAYRRNQTTNNWSTRWSPDTTDLSVRLANYQSQSPSNKHQPARPSCLRASPAATSNSFRTKISKGTNPKIRGSPSNPTKATGQGSPGTQRDSTVPPCRGSSCRDHVKRSRTTAKAMTRFKHLKNIKLTSPHGSLNSRSVRTKRTLKFKP